LMSASANTSGDVQSFSHWLREGHRNLWQRMVNHRFCSDMAHDRLPQAAFVRYLRYEHAFVRTAIAVFAYAVAKAPTPADQDHLLGVLNALAGEQQSYFQHTFEQMGEDAGVLPDEALPPAARGLRLGVLEIAASGNFGEILAAMLAAEWMYLTWCEDAIRQEPQAGAPADWIRLHVESGFRAQVHWLMRRLDSFAPALDGEARQRCRDNFGRMLALEIAFHDAPYEGELAL
jgi:thiaminase (transcriptional activator TenA)